MKNYNFVLFLVSWFFSTGAFAAPSEREYLVSCYAICTDFHESTIEGLERALAGLGSSAKDQLARKPLESNIALRKAGAFDESLVFAVLDAKVRLLANGRANAFPASGLSVIETAAITQYSGNDYKLVNQTLRASAVPPTEFAVYAAFLNAALEKLPPFIGTVKRGIKPFPGWEDHYRPGTVVTERAFTSTTSNLGPGPYGESIAIRIQSLSGRDISTFSSSPMEREVLFKAGSRFRVVKVERAEVLQGREGEIKIDLAEEP